jgi:hypothetical protein
MVAKSSLFAAFAAVVLSTIAVGSAVGPATASVSLWNASSLRA